MNGKYWRFAPLVLLALALLVWFESYLPSSQLFGQGFVVRFVVGLLAIVIAMVVLQLQHLEMLFKQVLEQFRQFHAQHTAGGEDRAVKQDAVQILIAALESEDPEVRTSARQNLERLTGESLGEDAAAWREWAAKAATGTAE